MLQAEASGRQQEELLSTAGSLLGSFLGGRNRSSSLATELRGAAGRALALACRRRAPRRGEQGGEHLGPARELESDLSDDILRITGTWDEKATAIDSVPVSLERTDVQVAQLVLAWVPVA